VNLERTKGSLVGSVQVLVEGGLTRAEILALVTAALDGESEAQAAATRRKLQYLVTVEAFGHTSTDWIVATSQSAALKTGLRRNNVRIEVGGRPATITPKEVTT
jgi:hypothetical protein